MNNIALQTCCSDASDVPVPTMQPRNITARLSAAVSALAQWVKQASAVHRQRRALTGLTDHQLEDIGLTRAQALREAARPFWDHA